MSDVNTAHKRLTDQVIDLKGVSGTAIGLSGNDTVLKVFLSDGSSKGKIPGRIDGFRVVVEHTGAFKRL